MYSIHLYPGKGHLEGWWLMKYIVILGDGMADEPLEQLGGKTPLESANIPTMDMLAGMGELGLAKTVPDSETG